MISGVERHGGAGQGPNALRAADTSAPMSSDVARHYEVIVSELRGIDLSEREWDLLHDALSGTPLDWVSYRYLWTTVDDAVTQGLADKWGVDGPVLVDKLRALRPGQTMAVIDAIVGLAGLT